MDVKRYDLVGEYECDIQELEDGDYVLYDDIKHLLTRPDPMSKEEAEILIKDLVDKAMEYRQTSTLINQDALTDAADKMVAILTIPRPDPAEVERLIDRLIGLIREEEYADSQGFFAKVTRLEEQIDKARADLLKLVGGGGK